MFPGKLRIPGCRSIAVQGTIGGNGPRYQKLSCLGYRMGIFEIKCPRCFPLNWRLLISIKMRCLGSFPVDVVRVSPELARVLAPMTEI